MRDNNISVSEPIFTGMIQCGSEAEHGNCRVLPDHA
nr:MAG TPA: hypothetical protein [Caudoviricetes sp.]